VTSAFLSSLLDNGTSARLFVVDIAGVGDSVRSDGLSLFMDASISSTDLPKRNGLDDGAIPWRIEILYAAMPSSVRVSDLPTSGMVLQSDAIRLNRSRSLSKCGT
jgi:hypothetical protein